MTITTESGIVSGLLPQIPFYKNSGGNTGGGIPVANGFIETGFPSAFTSASPGMAGAVVNGTTSTLGGTFPFVNPSSGYNYLPKATVTVGAGIAAVSFFDLLWYNSGITVTTTTAQTVSSVTLPARDDNGSTSGTGAIAWLYNSVATTNTAIITNTTISYTNSSGTSGRTGSLNSAGGGWPANAVAGTFMPFSLQAGDYGVESIQSITLGTSYVAGTLNLMIIRELAYIGFPAALSSLLIDWAMTGFPQLYAGTAMSLYIVPFGTSFGTVTGSVTYTTG